MKNSSYYINCPGRGSNSRPPAHRSFKHGQGALRLTHSATAAVNQTIFFISYISANHSKNLRRSKILRHCSSPEAQRVTDWGNWAEVDCCIPLKPSRERCNERGQIDMGQRNKWYTSRKRIMLLQHLLFVCFTNHMQSVITVHLFTDDTKLYSSK